jgi:hypothetical protein
MKITTYECDECFRSSDSVSVNHFRINHGAEMDPSGNGYVNNWQYLDLCIHCLPKVKARLSNLTIEPFNKYDN